MGTVGERTWARVASVSGLGVHTDMFCPVASTHTSKASVWPVLVVTALSVMDTAVPCT